MRLDVSDIAAFDARALGRCDHVIAHGVYSWVPEHVRAALLALAVTAWSATAARS